MNQLALDDLQVSAFLHARGFQLLRSEGPAYRKVFVFTDVPDYVVQDFYAGTAEVSARKLFESYRTLRAIARQSFAQERRMTTHATEDEQYHSR